MLTLSRLFVAQAHWTLYSTSISMPALLLSARRKTGDVRHDRGPDPLRCSRRRLDCAPLLPPTEGSVVQMRTEYASRECPAQPPGRSATFPRSREWRRFCGLRSKCVTARVTSRASTLRQSPPMLTIKAQPGQARRVQAPLLPLFLLPPGAHGGPSDRSRRRAGSAKANVPSCPSHVPIAHSQL